MLQVLEHLPCCFAAIACGRSSGIAVVAPASRSESILVGRLIIHSPRSLVPTVLSVEEASFHCDQYGMRAIVSLQLAHDAFHMALDRVFTDLQGVGDNLV